MKAFLFQSIIIFLLSHLKDANAQESDVERLLGNFINESVAGFPMWMKENRHIPDSLWGAANLTMDTLWQYDYGSPNDNPIPFVNLEGVLNERFYYGGEKNVKTSNFRFDLTNLLFNLNLSFGDENNYIEGNYNLNGSYVNSIPVRGTGTFRKTNIIESPLVQDTSGAFWVNNEGYFHLNSCHGYVYRPIFTNLTLNDLDASIYGQEITEIVKSWYHTQFTLYDFPNTGTHWCRYMFQRFLKRKIVDIIGIELPPTFPPDDKKSDMPPSHTRQPVYDAKRKAWALKTSITF